MKKSIINRLLWFNEFFFYLLYTFTFSVSIVESLKYRGFFAKHFFIDFNTLLYVTIISGIATLFFSPTQKSFINNIKRYYYSGQIFLFPFIFVSWVILTALNTFTYDNFVFTKLHIIPSLLPSVLFLSFFVLAVIKVSEISYKKRVSEISYKKRSKTLITSILIAGFLIIFLFQNQSTLFYILGQSRLIVTNPKASYSEKMAYSWGNNVYGYIELVRKITPIKSTILIPPRDDPWGLEGNDHLMRGFLYPRKVISYNSTKGFPKEKIDYVFLSWGFWRGSIDESKAHEFPNFNLKVKKIYIFNPDKKEVTKTYQENYLYKDPKYIKTYGLIEL